jgi:sodium transport system ATP-binding protein
MMNYSLKLTVQKKGLKFKMIQVEGLTKIFNDKKRGKVLAVNNLKFNCQKGQIFGLLGPNGAGKTTTLRILATMILPTKGKVKVNGFDVVKEPREVRKQIGFLSSETGRIFIQRNRII